MKKSNAHLTSDHPGGYWDGDVWYFVPPLPILTTDGRVTPLARIDVGQLVLPPGFTRDDLIHALLHPLAATGDGAP